MYRVNIDLSVNAQMNVRLLDLYLHIAGVYCPKPLVISVNMIGHPESVVKLHVCLFFEIIRNQPI